MRLTAAVFAAFCAACFAAFVLLWERMRGFD